MIVAKKGQAATEFIMTYGWAILVVLAAIGALAYFGVLSPDKFLPERCTFPAGVDCVDKAVITASNAEVQIALKNNVGYAVNITGTVAGTDDCASAQLTMVNGAAWNTTTGARIENNGQATVVVDCGTSLATGRFKADVTIPYTNTETGLAHRATGSIRGRAT
jgi:hypothetical protein